MSQSKDFKMILDFMVNVKTDPSKTKAVANEMQKILSEIHPEVDFSDDAIKDGMKSIIEAVQKASNEANGLIDALSSVDIDVNLDEALNSMDGLVKMIDDISNQSGSLDGVLGGVDGIDEAVRSFEVLKKAMESMGSVDVDSSLDGLSGEYEKAVKAVSNLIDEEKKLASTSSSAGEQSAGGVADLGDEVKKADVELQKVINSMNELSSASARPADSFDDIQAKFESVDKFAQQLSAFSEKGIVLRDEMLNLQASTGLVGGELDDLVDRAERAFVGGVGGSVGEAIKAIGYAKQTLGDFLSLDDIETFTKGAGAIAQVFDKDINEVIGGSRTFISQFGLEGQEAFELIGYAMRETGGKMDDTLDTLDEYSQLVKRAGYSATEFVGVLTNGMQAGTRDTDKLADSIKETNIRLMEGDITKELTDSISAYGTQFPEALGKTLTAIVAAGQDGSKTTKEVMSETSKAITEAFEGNDISATLRDKLARSISGTMAEDMGGEMWTKVFSAPLDTATIEAQAKSAGENISNAFGAVTFTEKLSKEFELLYTNASQFVAPIASQVGTALSAISGVAPAMILLKDLNFSEMKDNAASAAKGIQSFASSIFTKLVPATVVQTTATTSATAATTGLNTAMSMNPAVAIGAGIAVLVAGLALFLTKTEKGNQILDDAGEAMSNLWKSLEPLADSLISFGEELMGTLIDIGEAVFSMFIAPFQIAVSVVETVINTISGFLGVTTGLISIIQLLSIALDSVGGVIGNVGEAFTLVSTYIKATTETISGFIENLPALLGTVLEYAQYYLNPVNWVAGDEDTEARLSAKMNGLLNNMLGKAKDTINNGGIDLALEKAMTLKGDIDKNNTLNALVAKYKKTTDEIEKASIAEAIAKQVPEAVEGTNKLVDANGKVTEVMSINTAKAEEFANAQKSIYDEKLNTSQDRFIHGLQTSAEQFTENKKRSQELASQIVEQSKQGLDTSKIESDYKKLQVTLEKEAKNISENLTKGTELGLNITKAKFSPEFEEQFSGELAGLEQKAEEFKIGEKIGAMIKIKGDIDEQDKIGEMVGKFNEAKTEIEKANIAEAIARQVPAAVKVTGTMIDENGKLVKTYDLNIQKIDEVTEARKRSMSGELKARQDELIKGIESEGVAYQKSVEDMAKYKAEIDEAVKQGADTKDIEAKFNAVSDGANKSKKTMLEYAVQSEAAGVSTEKMYDSISKTIGTSVNQIKEMVKQQVLSKEEAEKQKASVDDLAKAWNLAKSEVDASVSKQVSALNELEKKKREGTLTDEDKEQYAQTLKETKELVKQSAEIGKIQEKTEYAVGLKKRAGVDALAAAKKELDTAKAKDDLSMSTYSLSQKEAILKENRQRNSYDDIVIAKKELETVERQREQWIEILKQKRLISSIDSNGKIEFAARVKSVDKAEIEKLVQDYNSDIFDQQSNIADLRLDVKLDEEELNYQIEELEKRKIQYEIEIGVRDADDWTEILDIYKKRGDKLSKEVANSLTAVSEAERNADIELKSMHESASAEEIEAVELKHKIIITEAKRHYADQQAAELDNQKEINSIVDTGWQMRVDAIKREQDMRIKAIEDSYSKQADVIKNATNIYEAAYSKSSQSELDEALDGVKQTADAKLKELEDSKKNGLIVEEDYEKQKLEIQNKYAKKAKDLERDNIKKIEVLKNASIGAELELERRKNKALAEADSEAVIKEIEAFSKKKNMTESESQEMYEAQLSYLEAEKEASEHYGEAEYENKKKIAEEQLKLLQKRFKFNAEDKKSYENLVKALDTTKSAIKDKGSELAVISKELQTTVTDSITNLFSGDPEEAANSWRKFLAVLVGMLEAKLSAFALDLVLSKGVMQYLGNLPFPANLVAMPAITALVNQGVRAVAQPLLDGIQSFGYGGSVDGRTLAVIGDNPAGGDKREWILDDPQLVSVVQSATIGANAVIANELKGLNRNLSNLSVSSDMSLGKLRTNLRVEEVYKSSRSR